MMIKAETECVETILKSVKSVFQVKGISRDDINMTAYRHLNRAYLNHLIEREFKTLVTKVNL